jgi:predicted O-methyltransferase YrrM
MNFQRRQNKGEVDRMFSMVALDVPTVAVEIGSKAGHWAVRFLENVPLGKLWCVDPWMVSRDLDLPEMVGATEKAYKRWQMNMSPWLGDRVEAIRAKSWEAIKEFPSDIEIDLLWLDGDHRTKAVKKDLRDWVPRVKEGGLVAGHDWTGGWQSHVRQGVRDWRDMQPKERRPKKIHTGFIVPSKWECFWFRKDWQ